MQPPAMSTLPSGSSVAEWTARWTVIKPTDRIRPTLSPATGLAEPGAVGMGAAEAGPPEAEAEEVDRPEAAVATEVTAAEAMVGEATAAETDGPVGGGGAGAPEQATTSDATPTTPTITGRCGTWSPSGDAAPAWQQRARRASYTARAARVPLPAMLRAA